jgi:hypothetical protein
MQTADSKIHDYLGAPGILTLEGRASIGSHATAKLTKHLLQRIVHLDEQARVEDRESLRQQANTSVSEEAPEERPVRQLTQEKF